jgi:threonine synthase
VVLDVEHITATASDIVSSRDRSIWRYAPLLPVGVPPHDSGPLRSLGLTPLHRATRAARRLGLGNLWIKDDGALPTGSLKDRASAVVVMRARELGVSRVIAASTGNAGVAMAAMARAADLPAIVLVPETAPAAKIAQLLIFGAELLLVRGNYDAAFALSREASLKLGWYCRNTAFNPFTAEGKKTVAFEICEQLTAALGDSPQRWRAPDRIYVSVGDGNIISSVHKGLKDLLAVGWIDRMPRLVGVQADGSAAVANAFKAGSEVIEPVEAHTIADSIAADRPADGERALKAALDTGGAYLTVSDDDILAAIAALGRDAAVFGEPAAAAAYAGLLQDADRGAIGHEEHVVVLVTGNGLKDVQAATRATGSATVIEPTLASLEEAITPNREQR